MPHIEIFPGFSVSMPRCLGKKFVTSKGWIDKDSPFKGVSPVSPHSGKPILNPLPPSFVLTYVPDLSLGAEKSAHYKKVFDSAHIFRHTGHLNEKERAASPVRVCSSQKNDLDRVYVIEENTRKPIISYGFVPDIPLMREPGFLNSYVDTARIRLKSVKDKKDFLRGVPIFCEPDGTPVKHFIDTSFLASENPTESWQTLCNKFALLCFFNEFAYFSYDRPETTVKIALGIDSFTELVRSRCAEMKLTLYPGTINFLKDVNSVDFPLGINTLTTAKKRSLLLPLKQANIDDLINIFRYDTGKNKKIIDAFSTKGKGFVPTVSRALSVFIGQRPKESLDNEVTAGNANELVAYAKLRAQGEIFGARDTPEVKSSALTCSKMMLGADGKDVRKSEISTLVSLIDGLGVAFFKEKAKLSTIIVIEQRARPGADRIIPTSKIRVSQILHLANSVATEHGTNKEESDQIREKIVVEMLTTVSRSNLTVAKMNKLKVGKVYNLDMSITMNLKLMGFSVTETPLQEFRSSSVFQGSYKKARNNYEVLGRIMRAGF